MSMPSYTSGMFIAFGNGVFVAGGYSGGGACLSRDGRTWEPILDLSDVAIFAITFAQGELVAYGFEGYDDLPSIFSSPDGITWARHHLAGNPGSLSLASGPDSVVSVGWRAILQSGSFGFSGIVDPWMGP